MCLTCAGIQARRPLNSVKAKRDSLLFKAMAMAMGDENTGTGDPKLRLAVAEMLKAIPGLKLNMAEAAKRSADTNQNNNCKEGKESNKKKDGDSGDLASVMVLPHNCAQCGTLSGRCCESNISPGEGQ